MYIRFVGSPAKKINIHGDHNVAYAVTISNTRKDAKANCEPINLATKLLKMLVQLPWKWRRGPTVEVAFVTKEKDKSKDTLSLARHSQQPSGTKRPKGFI